MELKDLSSVCHPFALTQTKETMYFLFCMILILFYFILDFFLRGQIMSSLDHSCSLQRPEWGNNWKDSLWCVGAVGARS